MLCQFDKLIYPKQADIATVDYMIAVYRPCGVVRDAVLVDWVQTDS